MLTACLASAGQADHGEQMQTTSAAIKPLIYPLQVRIIANERNRTFNARKG